MTIKKNCLLSVYIGKFPKFYNYWKKSALQNKNWDFYVITDQVTERYNEENIFFIPCTLEEYKAKVTNLLGQPYEDLSLKNLKKIADSKLIYGHLFYDIIKDYEWYGWTDLDVCYGDFDKFITPDVLENWDCIGYLNTKKQIFGPLFFIKTKHYTLYQSIPNCTNLITKSYNYFNSPPYTRRGASAVDETHLYGAIEKNNLKLYTKYNLNDKWKSIPLIRNGTVLLPCVWSKGKLTTKASENYSENYIKEVGTETLVYHLHPIKVKEIEEIDNDTFKILPLD